MHTAARNTLPAPDDPSLNALTQSVPIPASELLAMLDREPAQHAPTTYKERLMVLLPDKRAQRLNWCCAYWQFFTDGVHTWKRPSNACSLVILCPKCAATQAMEQHRKYHYLYPFVPDAGFTRISVPLDLSVPKQAYDRLVKHLRKLLPPLPHVMKIKPTRETVESLYCGSISPDNMSALKALYPSMRFLPCARSKFREELTSVLSPDLPRTPEAITALDAKYMKTRLLRVHGLTQEQRKNLSDERLSDKLDNSEPTFHQEPGKAPIHIPHCPHCGKLATKLCHWRHESLPEPTPEEYVNVVSCISPPKTE